MLKLISCNIGGHKYINLVTNFLNKNPADVITLQEIFISDARNLSKLLNKKLIFEPLRNRRLNDDPKNDFEHWGLATITNLNIIKKDAFYYEGIKFDPIDNFKNGNINRNKRALLYTSVNKNGKNFNITHTHFTGWMPGTSRDKQINHFNKMMKHLTNHPDLILCGDLNISRKDDLLFPQLLNLYKDNLPKNVITTIDPNLHPLSKKLNIVVDAFLTSRHYKVKNIKLIEGISDHKAINATIAKN